jgi:diguanylate cyclase (GGDEF)-like protein
MFLGIGAEEADLLGGGRPPERGTDLLIELAIEEEGTQRGYRFQARVARAVQGGIGVSFVDPDPVAVAALQRRSMEFQKARAVTPARRPGGRPEGEVRRIHAALHDLVADRLKGLLAPFFHDVRREMVEVANTSGTFLNQSSYFEANAALAQAADQIRETFQKGVLAEVDGLVSPGKEEPEANLLALSADDLALVDQSDFEDMLATSEVAARAEERFRKPLTELQRRIATLVQVPLDISACPLAPGVFADAFRAGVTRLGLHRRALEVVYRVFERTAVHGLGSFYDSVNGLLEREGVEPLAPPKPTVVQRPARPTPAPSPQDGPPAMPSPEPASSHGPGWPAPSAGPVAGPAPPPTVPHPGILPPEGGAPPSVPFYGPGLPWAVPPVGGQASSRAGDPFRVAQALMALAGMPGGAGAASPGPEAGPSGQPGPRDATMTEVLDALSALQVRDLSEASHEGVATPLQDRLVEQLSRGDARRRPTRLAPNQKPVLDLVGRFLDSVSDDLMLAEAVKQRVARVGNALHRAALRDERVLDDAAHPARRLLDQLGELDARQGPDATVWRREVDPLLDRIAENFGDEPEAFAEAARALEEILGDDRQRYRANVDQVVKTAQRQHAILRSRRKEEAARPLPPELAEWGARARRLRVGDRLELWAGTPRAERTTLAWVSDDQSTFAFVNRRGEKAASLSLQEVAMELRRGMARPVDQPEGPLVERAMDRVLEDVHRRVESRAQRDGTTGFLNARTFEQSLAGAMADANRRRVSHALCRVDLDRFRALTDNHGAAAGDAAVAAVARAISGILPESATAARVAADAIGVLLPDTSIEDAEEQAEAFRRAVRDLEFRFDDQTVPVTASVGIVAVPPDAEQPRDLVRASESACRAAQDAGGDRVQRYGFDDSVVNRHEGLVHALKQLQRALDAGHIGLRGQRIVPIGGDGSLAPHWEVLLELKDEEGQTVPAAHVAAAAEHYGHAAALDRLIIRTTLQWMADHPEETEQAGGLAINLSGQTLADDTLGNYVLDQLMQTRVPPSKVLFEVTETAAVTRMSSAQQFVRTLQDFGCRFCIDDFGSGQASFAYLRQLPVEYVKIDGQFVRDMVENENDYAVVKSINDVAHVMGKLTIAEFVHSEAVLEKLKELGVDYAQGYWLGRPRSLGEDTGYDRTVPLTGAADLADAGLTLQIATGGPSR